MRAVHCRPFLIVPSIFVHEKDTSLKYAFKNSLRRSIAFKAFWLSNYNFPMRTGCTKGSHLRDEKHEKHIFVNYKRERAYINSHNNLHLYTGKKSSRGVTQVLVKDAHLTSCSCWACASARIIEPQPVKIFHRTPPWQTGGPQHVSVRFPKNAKK